MDIPYISLPFTNTTHFRVGSSVTLKCHITRSNPPPTHYLWWHKGNVLIANTTSNMFTLSNLTNGDGGGYQCEAVNDKVRRKQNSIYLFFVWGKLFHTNYFPTQIFWNWFYINVSLYQRQDLVKRYLTLLFFVSF